MLTSLRDRSRPTNLLTAAIALAVLTLAFYLGQRPSMLWLGLLVGRLRRAGCCLPGPWLGLFALVAAALIVASGVQHRYRRHRQSGHPAGPRRRRGSGCWTRCAAAACNIVASPVNRPLALFLAAGLLSLLIGRVTWNPFVPVGGNFLLVQLAQWAIFAFSALAFWLAANLVTDEKTLWRLTAFFLLLGGGVAIARTIPGLGGLLGRVTTAAFIRAPFWVLLTALAGGQLLWNRQLALGWRLFLGAALLAALVYALVDQQEAASNWVGLAAVLGVLVWLRFPRLRGPLLVLLLLLAFSGLLLPGLYDFAGGDAEWEESGGSRLVLIERVVDVAMRNPITGLGPAAYRPYANATPLPYMGAYWVAPQINSHNNYVDLFAHGGLLGLALFFWFAWEIARLGTRLRRRYTAGFAAAYVNGMLAAGVGSLVIMMFADWILPFVYNIQFVGFQASVLVWLFLGGLLVLDNQPERSHPNSL
ncbi:MAG: O-antigen ligase family protein [Anaerolineae bacterium]